MPQQPVELVCFDLGGVLVRCVTSWKQACEAAGVPPISDVEDPMRAYDLGYASAELEVGRLDLDQFIQQVCQATDYSPQQVAAILDVWMIELFPGVAALLERLAAAPVRTAILSNTNTHHWELIARDMDRFGPLASITHRFASFQIGARKPDPAVYEHVETALGVAPQNILFFDDREDNITSAVWQQWQTQRINGQKGPVEQLEKYLRRYGVLD